MNVEVCEARAEDIPVLRRLMQLYLYDIATVDEWDLGDDGLFGDPDTIERFWAPSEERRSFLIRVDGKLAGFVLIRRGSYFGDSEARELSEFFVLRRYRRQGVGERAAHAVFEAFPGRWEVRELGSNADALAFWRTVIGRFTAGAFEEIATPTGTDPVGSSASPPRERRARNIIRCRSSPGGLLRPTASGATRTRS
jgi:predicted acetyltransferase